MRHLLLLCLALAACSSDPAPPVDSGPADTGPVQVDIGNGVDVLDVPAVPHDQGADTGAVDTGDAGDADAPSVDAVDAGVADAGADVVAVGDVGMDASACGPCVRPNAETLCLAGAPARCAIARCLPGYGNCDADAANGCEINTATDGIHCGGCGQMCTGARSCRSGQCLAPDASVDPRMNCSDPTVRCTSNEHCQAMCLPYMDGHPWCCALNHECRPYLLRPVCPML